MDTHKKNSSGMVLLFTLLMLSIVVLLVQQLVRGVWVGSQFNRAMVNREYAELLALSGINLAIADVKMEQEQDKKQQGDKTVQAAFVADGKKISPEQKLLERVLPYLNRWHKFELHRKIDGIDGTIRICISCEEGKININEAFDFKKMVFKPTYQKILKGLSIPGKIPEGEILNLLTEFFKHRKKRLDDVSQLLDIFGKYNLDIFYKPPSLDAGTNKKYLPNVDVMLQDIFTVWTNTDKVNPLFLSDALCKIFDLRQPIANDATARKDRFKQFVQNFKKEMASDWVAHWKQLELIYDKTPKVLPVIKDIFSKEFVPKTFSVLSCGKVGEVEQKLLVVIQEQDRPKKTEDKEGKKEPVDQKTKKGSPDSSKQQDKQQDKIFKVLRVYWL